ncbi:SDR family NAD(P)-dependent oxidoreductase, partial [Plantactinospora siamensis]
MSRRTVLITGTSSGIGLATALATAGAGWTTIATMRDPDRADRLRDAAAQAGVADHIDIHALDVTRPDTIDSCIEAVIAEHGHLDALINNAGA